MEASRRAGRSRVTVARRVAAVVQAAFFLSYPFVIYVAYTRLGTRALGGILLLLYGVSLALRMRSSADEVRALVKQHLGLVLVIGLAIASDDPALLLLLPVFVSLYLLWTFGRSLWVGPPMIERFARMVDDDLPDFTLPYCRKWTVAWCVFFTANGATVIALAIYAPLTWWALYTGLLFYGLLGALLAGEFVMRKLWFRYYLDGSADRIFAAFFPAERTENGRRSLAYHEERAASRLRGAASRE